ncbi:MAG: methylmalonyl-CoA epimerase [Devosiaceae bacterium]|nr:methylmalonyl-CoA epimerase [Devosiaceae bacterium]
MIGKLNHVAIAVPNLDKAISKYRDVLGANVSPIQDLPEHGVSVVFVELENSKIELLYPLGDNSPIERFLEKNPNGATHHICFEVEDIIKSIALLKAKGARVLGDGKPKIGAHGLPVVFLHPKDFDGVLIELEEVD